MKIGNTVRKLRKQKGITQMELARECNISQTYLSQIENDTRNPTVDVLEGISKALDIPYPVLAFLSLTIDDVPKNKHDVYMTMEKVMFGLVENVFVH
jgi:transcriptional regulator with XRE-family HTH domain